MRKIVYLWLAATGFSGCSKDLNEFIPAPGTDTSWVQSVQAGAPVLALMDSLQNSFTGDSVNLAGSDSIAIQPFRITLGSAWLYNSTAYSGRALLQTLFLQTAGAFLRNGISTQSNGKVYGQGGALYIGLVGSDGSLEPSHDFRVFVETSGAQSDTTVWEGAPAPGGVDWTSQLFDTATSAAQIFFSADNTGWFMFGSPIAGSGQQGGSLTLVLPTQFTNVNTAAYVVFSGYHADVRLQGSYAFRTFSATDLPPVDSATVVTISLIGQTYYFGALTMSMSAGATPTVLTPQPSTLASIDSALARF